MPPLPRPDPSKGVFETMLVIAGAPVELNAHLARLTASLGALFDRELPPGTRDSIREKAAGWPLARLRLTVAPDGESAARDTRTRSPAVRIAIEAVDPALLFPDRAGAVALRSLPAEGGLGRHKWADRSPLLAGADHTVPLLTDADGAVLEAGWANLFAVHDGALFTPPTDGRLLPGVTRAAAIAIARGSGIGVEERRLDRDDLLAADEVFLTGSIRGVVPAHSLDGRELGANPELSLEIADGLRRRWRSHSGRAAAAALAGARIPGPRAR
jgi:para-aminobenzoate synthetase / 4-amino-4-deoxychorismate lyase